MTDLEWALSQNLGPHVAIVITPDGRVGAVNRNDGPERRQLAVTVELKGPNGTCRALVWVNTVRADGPGRWRVRFSDVVWTEYQPEQP